MKKIKKEKIKTWFVTGASSGVGHEMCRQLLERGYNVIAVSRRVPDFEHENALCLSVDVTKPETIDAAIKTGIEKFGEIDVLANNAGMSGHVTLEEEDLEHMKNVMETNFFGAFNTMNAILPHFRENKNGTIINCTSRLGLTPALYRSAYCSSKYALEALTGVCWEETASFCRVMAFELGGFGARMFRDKAYKNKITIDTYINAEEKIKLKSGKTVINDLKKAITLIIDTAEQEKMPRRLILGKDACYKVELELNYLKNDLKNSYRLSSKYSKIKNKNSFLQNIFSVKNEYSNNIKRKVITILGIKLKFRQNAETGMVGDSNLSI